MKLRKEFKKETGMNAYINRVGRNTEFHQTYTKWLENKLNEVLKLDLACVIKAEGDSVCEHKFTDIKIYSNGDIYCVECGKWLEQTYL